MFRLPLFRIRAFTFGTLSTFLSAIARGGLMFMLIIWLQGIWLPLHGVDFADTPLRAGIYMLPLTLGMLVAGPTSGYLSDRYGARWFATGGMLASALCFFLLTLLPIDFPFWPFALVLAGIGVSMGMFASPNRAAVMNSLPPQHRGAGGGMNQTFQNSAQVLSIGVFFTLMILGLASNLPHTLSAGLQAHGVSAAAATSAAHEPPVSVLFAAFLGYNPVEHLLGAHVLATLPAAGHAVAHWALVLPTADLGAVSLGAARGVPVRDPRLPDRGRRVADARRQVPLRRACRATVGAADSRRRAAERNRREWRGELRPRRERARANYYDSGGAPTCALSGMGSRRFV